MRLRRRTLALALAGTIVVGNGCVTTESMTSSFQSSKEREIFSQAVGVSTAVGAAAGAAIGSQLTDKRTKGALIGVLVGGLAGNLVGRTIGRNQIANYRDVRMSNDQLEALVRNARDYNRQVADYNGQLEQQIASMERGIGATEDKIARVRTTAERRRGEIRAQAQERAQIERALVRNQRAGYRTTLAALKEEEVRLDASIQRLDRMQDDPAIIGGSA